MSGFSAAPSSCSGSGAGGILPFAKPAGMTSFAAIGAVKRALRPENRTAAKGRLRVGHTGTLDAFADGLLVVLTGSFTRLAPFITALPKTYHALVRFGIQTDTLDPQGTIIRRTALPSAGAIRSVLPAFTGNILQKPPEYSALKQNGERLSDLMRKGSPVVPAARPVTVYRLDAELFYGEDGRSGPPGSFPDEKPVTAAVLTVRCSKGTYVRALARDIAAAAGSAAFLLALRRLCVGPFRLADSAGFSLLPAFASGDAVSAAVLSEEPVRQEKPGTLPAEEEIRAKRLLFTPELASACGLSPLFLADEAAARDFRCGKPFSPVWLAAAESGFTPADGMHYPVFFRGSLAGFIRSAGEKFRYDFVAGRD